MESQYIVYIKEGEALYFGAILPFSQHILPFIHDLKDISMAPGDSEEQLARRAQQGDRQAFLTLYDRYFAKVFNRVKSRVPAHEAEDVTQEVFIAVVRSLKSFEQRSLFSTWLYTIVQRQIADFYRSQKRNHYNQAVDLENVQNLLTVSSYEGNFMDERVMVQRAFRELPKHYQEVILLRFADGLTFAEIARQRDQSLEAVKSLYRRAIQSLRNQIGEVQREQ
jgi:RNA polymerase sigma-70 factor (ECF subfamily)